MAWPMPLPAPVTRAWRFAMLILARRSRGARQVVHVLRAGRMILLRPDLLGIADLGRLVHDEGRIGQMRTRHRAEIGAAGGNDRIGVVGLGDRADRDGRHLDLVADLVGEGRLEQAAIDRLFFLHHLAGRAVDQVGAGFLEHAGEDRRILRRVAAFVPVVRRQAHRHRLFRGQRRGSARNTSSGKRARPAWSPPYSSSRRLVSGDRKLDSR